MRTIILFTLFLLGLTLLVPAYIAYEEARALKNIKINKRLAEWDFSTAEFYTQVCAEHKLVNVTCNEAKQAMQDYKLCKLNIKILGF